ncbi:MAG: carbohydrate ABC transporter permease [Chloroflexi bacterium]|nr:carbohydrate ABC transporter permease [Chloroflexota bacterium]
MVDSVVLQQPSAIKTVPEKPGTDWRRYFGNGVMYAVLLFFAFLALFPFIWMISNSLMTIGETQVRRMFPSVPQWGNYAEAWDQAEFSKYFLNSCTIVGITLAGLLVISILAAYAFGRIQFRGRDTIFTLLLVTLMIPQSVTLIPNFLMVAGKVVPLPAIGTGEALLTWSWENTWIDTYAALTIPFMGSAFSIFLLRQFFAQIPYELFDAARIDGAGHFRFLVQIVLPISRAPIMTVTLLTFIASWNSFLWPLIVTNSDRLRPITVGLYNFTDEAGTRTNLLMAGALITILPILILYFLTQKTFTEGIATTGLKG